MLSPPDFRDACGTPVISVMLVARLCAAPHLGSEAAHRRANSITEIRGTAAVGGAAIGSGT